MNRSANAIVDALAKQVVERDVSFVLLLCSSFIVLAWGIILLYLVTLAFSCLALTLFKYVILLLIEEVIDEKKKRLKES